MHRFIYICQQEHIEKYGLAEKLETIAPECIIIPINYITEGAVCTVLLADKYIDNNDSMMIADSDQYVNTDVNEYISALGAYDGLIMTMSTNHPKCSYIKFDENGFVAMVREEEAISNEATVVIISMVVILLGLLIK